MLSKRSFNELHPKPLVLVIYVLRQGLFLQRPGWPRTYRNLSASASGMLGPLNLFFKTGHLDLNNKGGGSLGSRKYKKDLGREPGSPVRLYV